MDDDAHVCHDVHTGVLLDRPGLNLLRERIRSGDLQVVIARAIDRLSRDQTHLGGLMYEATDHDVLLGFVTERPDDRPTGQLLRQVMGFVARMEHEEIRERTQRRRRARARAGKLLPSSFPLYGYQWADAEKSRYALDPETAPIVQRIFREVVAGTSIRQVRAQSMAEGVPTPTQLLERRGMRIGRPASTAWGKGTITNFPHPPPSRHGAYGRLSLAEQLSQGS